MVLTYHFKGETGILKKKFSNLQKEIEQGQEDYKSIQTDNQKLEAFIASLQKDIAGLKVKATHLIFYLQPNF